MPSRGFLRDGLEVLVRAPHAAPLDWLEEFGFGPVGAGHPSRRVRVWLDVDPERLARLATATVPTGEQVECFTLDGPERRLPVVRDEDGTEFTLDPEHRFAVGRARHADGTPEIHVVAASDRPDARLAVMRVLRELFAANALRDGALPLHASAVADPSGATLFVGARRSGKSTLLLHALAGDGVRYLANDRVFARLQREVAHAEGSPTIVSLREGSFACLRGPSLSPDLLAEELRSGAWHYASSVEECRRNRRAGETAEGSGHRQPPGLSPAQLCALLGVESCAGARIARIMLPRVEPERPRFRLRRLVPEEAARRALRTGLIAGGRVASFLSHLTRGAHTNETGSTGALTLSESVAALCRQVPCFECSLGAGAYEAPSVWDAIRESDAA